MSCEVGPQTGGGPLVVTGELVVVGLFAVAVGLPPLLESLFPPIDNLANESSEFDLFIPLLFASPEVAAFACTKLGPVCSEAESGDGRAGECACVEEGIGAARLGGEAMGIAVGALGIYVFQVREIVKGRNKGDWKMMVAKRYETDKGFVFSRLPDEADR